MPKALPKPELHASVRPGSSKKLRKPISRESIEGLVNRNFLGDCLDILPRIPNESIDLIIVDPSFGINNKSGKWHGHYIKGKHVAMDKGIVPIMNDDKIVNFFPEAERVLKSSGAIYVFTNDKAIPYWQVLFEQHFRRYNTLVWVKNNHTMGNFNKQYRKKYELIMYGVKKKNTHLLRGHKGDSDVIECSRPRDAKRIHPNQKPIELLKKLIKKSSSVNDIVLDMCAGSFTLGIAARAMKRRFIQIEKDPVHYKNGCLRMQGKLTERNGRGKDQARNKKIVGSRSKKSKV